MNGQARGEGEPFERRSPARAARAARARAKAFHPAGSAREALTGDERRDARGDAAIREEVAALRREVEHLRAWCLGLEARQARLVAVLTVAAAVIEGPRLLRRLLALAALDELGVDRGE
jgi:hydroxypyruvate isomerase